MAGLHLEFATYRRAAACRLATSARRLSMRHGHGIHHRRRGHGTTDCAATRCVWAVSELRLSRNALVPGSDRFQVPHLRRQISASTGRQGLCTRRFYGIGAGGSCYVTRDDLVAAHAPNDCRIIFGDGRADRVSLALHAASAGYFGVPPNPACSVSGAGLIVSGKRASRRHD